ncbi:unnamed protein product [Vitrella brassicaformis CCMP3155]|uniref:Uncharacterized protein n=1 Tax=Vitrella brassicaformis (strain CCMP3155) TaxID=1169540 RepID=A0A0G4FLI1_VITBC|nr:unnamed protein product [Vitrella brassicaformis CCMP3155]|eukprot:CEM14629.1 unnamed protein product [Vitrella brassicaformis CCMP3155]
MVRSPVRANALQHVRYIFSFETVKVAIIFCLLSFEFVVRTLVLTFYKLFPFRRLLDILYDQSVSGVSMLFSKRLEGPRQPQLSSSTVELLEDAGLNVEDHFAETPDGFVLVLHRIVPPNQGINTPTNTNMHGLQPGWGSSRSTSLPSRTDPFADLLGPGTAAVTNVTTESDSLVSRRRGGDGGLPLLFMHGLMMSDECWVCNKEISLPIYLARKGYDVWLANNRGNKYSWKHRFFKRDDKHYWDFSIDELARYDVPTCVDLVLRETRATQCIYVGFSNGTAQMFAALSTQPALNRRIATFIALAPACRLKTLSTKEGSHIALVYPLLTFSKRAFFLVFGKKAMLSTTDVWKRMLARGIFVRVIDLSLDLLFNWHVKLAEAWAKQVFYFHLYSATSVKVARHWFQLLGSGEFEHYDDATGVGGPADVEIPKLSDNQWLLLQVPRCVFQAIPKYEHLDFLVAKNAPQELFPRVESAVEHYSNVYNGTPEPLPMTLPSPERPLLTSHARTAHMRQQQQQYRYTEREMLSPLDGPAGSSDPRHVGHKPGLMMSMSPVVETVCNDPSAGGAGVRQRLDHQVNGTGGIDESYIRDLVQRVDKFCQF